MASVAHRGSGLVPADAAAAALGLSAPWEAPGSVQEVAGEGAGVRGIGGGARRTRVRVRGAGKQCNNARRSGRKPRGRTGLQTATL